MKYSLHATHRRKWPGVDGLPVQDALQVGVRAHQITLFCAKNYQWPVPISSHRIDALSKAAATRFLTYSSVHILDLGIRIAELRPLRLVAVPGILPAQTVHK